MKYKQKRLDQLKAMKVSDYAKTVDLKALKQVFDYLKTSDYLETLTTQEHKDFDVNDFFYACLTMANVKKAIKNGTIYVVCSKYPRGNLDTGRHYYDLHFVNAEGKLQRLWLYGYFGQDEQNRDRHMSKYCFWSGCIGMSRLLDSTDSFFNFAKRIYGDDFYMQLNSVL